jgi:hypothetical protein
MESEEDGAAWIGSWKRPHARARPKQAGPYLAAAHRSFKTAYGPIIARPQEPTMDWMTSITNAQLRSGLISAVGTIGLLWYYLCVIDLGVRPTSKGDTASGFRQFQALSVTTISVSLATYVGYVVGIPLNGDAAAAPLAAAGAAPLARVSMLQWLAAALYVISLVLAIWFYAQKKDATEPAITGLAKSLLGFVAGVFALSLNVPSAP